MIRPECEKCIWNTREDICKTCYELSKFEGVKMTKSELTKEINILKKFGWKLLNFNFHYKIKSAHIQDHPDTLAIHPTKGIIYIEIKIGKDSLSPGQIEFMDIIKSLEFLQTERGQEKIVRHILMTDKNHYEIIEGIIND